MGQVDNPSAKDPLVNRKEKGANSSGNLHRFTRAQEEGQGGSPHYYWSEGEGWMEGEKEGVKR